MSALTAHDIGERLTSLPGWEYDGERISKRFEFDSYVKAIAFIVRVAERAEAADHHPDLDSRYQDVVVHLRTHSAGGVTAKDLEMAAEVEAVADAG